MDYIVIDPTLCAIVKVVITDRGGGCVRALTLTEEQWAVRAARASNAPASCRSCYARASCHVPLMLMPPHSLGRGEAPLIIPSGFQAVTMAPSADSLDPFHAASGDLVGTSIFLRLKDFGWCLGKLVDRVPNRTRKIGGVQVVSMTGASASPILQ